MTTPLLKSLAEWEDSANGLSYLERAQSLIDFLNSKIDFQAHSVSPDKEQLILKEILCQ